MRRIVAIVGLVAVLAAAGFYTGRALFSVETATAITTDGERLLQPPGKVQITQDLLSRSELSDKVLRWTVAGWTFTAGSVDPYNGVELLSEHWLRFDAYGVPIEYFAIFRLTDGSVAQSMYATREEQRIVLDRAAATDPDGTPVFEVGAADGAGAVLLDRLYPQTNDISALVAAGYVEQVATASVEALVPPTPRAMVTLPVWAFAPSGEARVFKQVFTSADDGATRVRILTIDAATGRQIMWNSVLLDADRQLLQEVRIAEGLLEVFYASEIPWPPPSATLQPSQEGAN